MSPSNISRHFFQVIFSLGLGFLPALGDVRTPAIFATGMVLQRDAPIRLWGWAEAGEKITLAFAGQTAETEAGADGKWKVTLKALPAGGPFQLVIRGRNTLTFDDVWMGEVWLAGGQSNMEMAVSGCADFLNEKAAANFPKIRMYASTYRIRYEPEEEGRGRWITCSPAVVGSFTAVGYFFARDLHTNLKVPIGMIRICWGGTGGESWVPKEVLLGDPRLSDLMDEYEPLKTLFPNPDVITNTKDIVRLRLTPTGQWNAMVNPLIPYGIRGAIWYQGENNANTKAHALQYQYLLPSLIQAWRDRWGQGPFPFYFVQIANYRPKSPVPGQSVWALLRESQRRTLSVTNTAMAVAIDVGNATNIHPIDKQPVGRRLALPALANVYQQSGFEWSGPLFSQATFMDHQARLAFRHTDGGMFFSNRDPVASGFTVAGSDRRFYPAKGQIDGDEIVLSSEKVAAPVAVRYAWADNPDAGLYNRAGLPASPFRTDDWDFIQASSGYSSNQGKFGWNYFAWDGMGYQEMNWDAPQKTWQGPETYCLVQGSVVHPGAKFESVRSWTAHESGVARLSGRIHAWDNKGDGVSCRILKGKDTIWNSMVPGSNRTVGTTYEVSVPIKSGEIIYFHVGPGPTGDSSNDATLWDPVIEMM